MTYNKLARVSFSAVSVLLCAAVVSSCGSSNESKKKDQSAVITTTNPDGASVLDAAPNAQPEALPGNNQAAAPVANRADGIPLNTDAATDAGLNNSAETAAPIGRTQTAESKKSNETAKNESKNIENKKSNPLFDEAVAIKTGGKSADLSYTSNSDDGLMDLFRSRSTGVSAEQQTMNKKLAQAISGAKLKKVGSELNLDLAVDEFNVMKLYKLKAIQDGNKMKLSSVSVTGDLEFQGGFVKCLEESCENAYAKIKLSGAYTRIIFRTGYMNKHFLIQSNVNDAKFNLWKTYIDNTISGNSATAVIDTVKMSSFEVLNGKAGLGMQLLSKDNESVSLSMPLVAPESGTVLNQSTTRSSDLSVNYNLPTSVGKLSNLSAAISDTRLVNNNGKGQIKLKMIFPAGAIWMVLTRVEIQTLTAAQVQAFEATVPMF